MLLNLEAKLLLRLAPCSTYRSEMSEKHSDDDLMLAYAGGDTGAFDQLYERYRQPLYRYLVHATGQAAIADDLYQDVWSRIIASRTSFRPKFGSNFKAGPGFKRWAFRIAHNRLIDHWRSIKTLDGDSESTLNQIADDQNRQPEFEQARDEQAKHLKTALMALPNDQRAAFLLQQESGLSLADIARREGVGRETIKSRLRYAINKLRDRLGPSTETLRP